AKLGHMCGRVFADARLGVVHTDDNERLDLSRLNAFIRGLADVPVLPRNEGSGGVEKILSVMKIEDGKMARQLLRISWRCIDDEVALIAKKARAKLLVFAELG